MATTPEQIRQQRIAAQLSQAALSRLARVSRFKLNSFEAGGPPLEADELARLETAILAQAHRLQGQLAELELQKATR